MKTKIFILLVLFAANLFVSCSGDDGLTNERTNKRTESDRQIAPVENFKMAINEMNKPQYFPTEEYTKKYGDELSPKRKAILFKPALILIYSTSKTEEKLDAKTMADTNQILNRAFKIYISKTSKK